jgi:hypothetical protein
MKVWIVSYQPNEAEICPIAIFSSYENAYKFTELNGKDYIIDGDYTAQNQGFTVDSESGVKFGADGYKLDGN